MFDSLPIATILISYVAVLFALSVHEAAHASTSYVMGDDTAKRLGRMTLNPMAHIDWIGTVLLPLIGAFTGFNVIGWAKPVPVDTSKLTRRFRTRVSYAIVASAGPISNLVQSVIFLAALCIYIRVSFGSGLGGMQIFGASLFAPVEALLRVPGLPTSQALALTLLGRLVIINIGLAIFNLIPFGPLDGAGILRGFLPFRWLAPFDRAQPTISIILLILFLVGAMKYILWPLYALAERFYITPLARLFLGV